MCGICGQFNFSDVPVDPQNVARMADSLAHRGPDDRGIYAQGPIGLGHRRLSIIDLSPSGHQPMWNDDHSLAIVFNGEVYNFQEIKKQLLAKGYHFNSTSDTEVVVNAIHCWGIDKALSIFIGMFAFAVWDLKEKKLILARDRAGIKPLYYHVQSGGLLFGSELKALMAHSDFKKRLNLTALAQYFITGYFLDPWTVFDDTFKLSPGHYLSVRENGERSLHKYWSLDSVERGSFRGSYEEAAGRLEHLFESAFAYRLVADVPVGLFLSGGVDSSLVSAILKKKINADILNITIGFREEQYDESPKAKMVSGELGVKQIIHHIDTQEAQDSLLKFPEIYDEPFGDTSGIPTYILSKLARTHVKVALSADGGDEQFCGYESYASYAKSYDLVKRFPWLARHMISRFVEKCVPYQQWLSWRMRKSREEMYFPQIVARYEKMFRLIDVGSLKDLIMLMNEKAWSRESIPAFLPVRKEDLFEGTVLASDFVQGQKEDVFDTMMRTDYTAFLRDDILVKTDRASMAVSLECRDPFLDHRIAEFAYSLPLEFLFHDGEHKRILKRLLRKWISEPVVSAPKRGFMIPLYYWLRGVWKPIVLDFLSEDRVNAFGVLNAGKVRKELDHFYRYHGSRAEKIWMMLNFQMWAERWFRNS